MDFWNGAEIAKNKLTLIIALVIAVGTIYNSVKPYISDIASTRTLILEHKVEVLTKQVEAESELDKAYSSTTLQLYHGNDDNFDTPKSSMVSIQGEIGEIFTVTFDRSKSTWVYLDFDGNWKVVPKK